MNLFDEIREEEKIEFHLKNSLNRDLNILSIKNVQSPTQKINFEKRSVDKLVTYAWINRSDISQKEIDNIKTNGIEINNKTQFIVGFLFNEEISEEDLNYDKEHNFLLCKIIIGNSFCKIYETKEEIDDFITDEMDSKINLINDFY